MALKALKLKDVLNIFMHANMLKCHGNVKKHLGNGFYTAISTILTQFHNLLFFLH